MKEFIKQKIREQLITECNENGYEYYFLLGKNFELVDGLSVIGDNKNII